VRGDFRPMRTLRLRGDSKSDHTSTSSVSALAPFRLSLPAAGRHAFSFSRGGIFLKLNGRKRGEGAFTSYNNLEYNITEYYDIDIMTKAIFSKDHKYTIEQLKKARLEADLDQADVAKLLGRTQPHISKIEAGQRRLDITQIKEFARIYKKPIDFFIKK